MFILSAELPSSCTLVSRPKSEPPKESIPKSCAVNVSPTTAFLVTLLIIPPVPPLPNSRAFGPLRISTCSTLYSDL